MCDWYELWINSEWALCSAFGVLMADVCHLLFYSFKGYIQIIPVGQNPFLSMTSDLIENSRHPLLAPTKQPNLIRKRNLGKPPITFTVFDKCRRIFLLGENGQYVPHTIGESRWKLRFSTAFSSCVNGDLEVSLSFASVVLSWYIIIREETTVTLSFPCQILGL